MRANQFTLRAFNGVAMFHSSFERIGLLRLPALLQNRVVFAHYQRAMPLAFVQVSVLTIDTFLLNWPGGSPGGGLRLKPLIQCSYIANKPR